METKKELPDWVKRSIERGSLTEKEYLTAISPETAELLANIGMSSPDGLN